MPAQWFLRNNRQKKPINNESIAFLENGKPKPGKLSADVAGRYHVNSVFIFCETDKYRYYKY